MHHLARFCLILSALCTLILTSCGGMSARQKELVAARAAAIRAEPQGDWFIGRRFHIKTTHFWGYLRRPGEQWFQSRLVVFNEKFQKQPDRLPETPASGPAYGYDHNHEYRIWGYYSGRQVYDPNSNMQIPEFVLKKWELLNTSPGWLFKPGERFNGKQLLRGEPGAVPGR